MLEDLAYYRRRAAQEDEAARSAACQAARDRHLELAEAYRARCATITGLLADGRPGPAGR